MSVRIYKITNLINGKIYVGQTIRTIEERFKEHCRKGKCLIGKAIKKCGKENFKLELIAECESHEEANELEMHWIKTLNCKVPNGYNLTDGGVGHRGCKHSEETKEIIRAKNRGRKHTEEARLLMSIGQHKRYEDPLVHKQLSDAHKKRYEDPNERKKLSDAQKKRYEDPREREKQSAKQKKRWAKIREQKNNSQN